MTAIYIGDGEWIPGVPARNLSEEEYAAHRAIIEQNEAAIGRTLYMVAHPVVIEEDAGVNETETIE